MTKQDFPAKSFRLPTLFDSRVFFRIFTSCIVFDDDRVRVYKYTKINSTWEKKNPEETTLIFSARSLTFQQYLVFYEPANSLPPLQKYYKLCNSSTYLIDYFPLGKMGTTRALHI